MFFENTGVWNIHRDFEIHRVSRRCYKSHVFILGDCMLPKCPRSENELDTLPSYLHEGDKCEADGKLDTKNNLNNSHFIFDVYEIKLNPHYVVLNSEHSTSEDVSSQLLKNITIVKFL